MRTKNAQVQEKPRSTCGIIMPISAIDGCDAAHWAEVLTVLKEVGDECDYRTSLVSDSNESGIIHKRIVQQIYESDVVICDVSGKNPNVMFELGMRLTFDKPTVVIKDDATDYSFDTAPVDHLLYPRDLHYTKIKTFKTALAAKLKATKEGGNKHSFLKSFGTFQQTELSTETVKPEAIILNEIQMVRQAVEDLRKYVKSENEPESMPVGFDTICASHLIGAEGPQELAKMMVQIFELGDSFREKVVHELIRRKRTKLASQLSRLRTFDEAK